MSEPIWLELDVVLALHDMQLAAFGGAAGLRDAGLLESALYRPRNVLHYAAVAPSLARLAAAYAFGIVENHPFVDGNKRTGLVVSFTFLKLNGQRMTASEEDAYQTFLNLASGALSEEALADWMAANSQRERE
ncbi:MAG: type II toxin-antitoxin system death-on-curing family toxin [Candidatus Korobacteraceae bacterium]